MNKLSFTEFNVTQEKKQELSRRVDFRNNPKDRRCLELLAGGKTNNCIRIEVAKVGNTTKTYSDAQIRYRGILGDVNRNDIRNNIERPYTRMLLDRERSREFTKTVENYAKTTCPEMWAKIHKPKS